MKEDHREPSLRYNNLTEAFKDNRDITNWYQGNDY
jgi:hypothetical protein